MTQQSPPVWDYPSKQTKDSFEKEGIRVIAAAIAAKDAQKKGIHGTFHHPCKGSSPGSSKGFGLNFKMWLGYKETNLRCHPLNQRLEVRTSVVAPTLKPKCKLRRLISPLLRTKYRMMVSRNKLTHLKLRILSKMPLRRII